MNAWNLKKEITTHVAASLVFFAPLIFLHSMGGVTFLSFFAGVLLGSFLPDIDHLIYVLFLKPKEITSQRVRSKLASGSFYSVVTLLFSTRDERKKLIFHNIVFQLFFVIFSFLIVSSSSSIFGRGLVLSFLLSLVVDQVLDIRFKLSATRWLHGFFMPLTSQQFNLYVFIQGLLIFVLSYVF